MSDKQEYSRVTKIFILSGLVLLALFILAQLSLYKKVPFAGCGGKLGVSACPLGTYCKENAEDEDLIEGYCSPYLTPLFEPF